jgi:choline dehydrogenase
MNKSGEIDARKEALQTLLDQAAYGRIDRRAALRGLGALGLAAAASMPGFEEAFAAGDTQKKLTAAAADTFDVIVIGGGSAGAVVAARASEDPHRQVLLLEAGPTDEGVASIANPLVWFTNIQSAFDWKYSYTPQEAVRQRTILIPRGKVLGGSSSINALIWVRGAPSDFDHWANGGAAGWGWSDVLPYFKRAEDWQLGASSLRGAAGPLRCELPSEPHPIAVALVEAAKSLGLPGVEDVNGATFGGGSLANLNIKDGTRHNTARAYLRPAMSRPNLTVLTQAQALRLVFAGNSCRGVQVNVDGTSRVVRARHEVVLCAGAIDTPRLLLLSGVGDPTELRKLSIPVVAALKGVGKNFHDHPLLMGVNFEASGKIAPFRNNCGGSQAFWSSTASIEVPDIMVVPIQMPYASPELAKLYPVPENAFAVTPGLMRPISRGHIRLLSAAPNGPLEIQPNFLQERADVEALMRSVGFALDLGAQPAFRDLVKRPASPSSRLAPRELEEFVRLSCSSYFHPVGTCKMGVDSLAVVDPRLKVHGLSGLSVADASVMPQITSGNTHAPCVMIGERAAEFLGRA